MLPLLLSPALAVPPAPPDHAAQHRELERVADGVAADVKRIGLGASLDLFSTAIALRNCPTCAEGNPLGFSSEARGSLKAAMTVASLASCYKLRRGGHHRAAAIVSWTAFAVQAVAAANNLRLAARGH